MKKEVKKDSKKTLEKKKTIIVKAKTEKKLKISTVFKVEKVETPVPPPPPPTNGIN